MYVQIQIIVVKWKSSKWKASYVNCVANKYNSSFHNQPTGSPEFKRGHRVRSDGRTIIYNVRNFFYESKRRLEPITVGNMAQITAEATGLSKNTVKQICSEGAITGLAYILSFLTSFCQSYHYFKRLTFLCYLIPKESLYLSSAQPLWEPVQLALCPRWHTQLIVLYLAIKRLAIGQRLCRSIGSVVWLV